MKEDNPGKNVQVYFMDEARYGQKGTLTRVWAETGTRPTVIKQTRYEWAYIYGAVNPLTGENSALVAPSVNTGTMNEFLKILSAEVAADAVVVLILDRAGWHVSGKLVIPANIKLLHLPPYSPELNPVETLWLYIKSHFLSNRVYDDYNHLVNAGTEACRAITTDIIKSVCAATWIVPGCQA